MVTRRQNRHPTPTQNSRANSLFTLACKEPRATGFAHDSTLSYIQARRAVYTAGMMDPHAPGEIIVLFTPRSRILFFNYRGAGIIVVILVLSSL